MTKWSAINAAGDSAVCLREREESAFLLPRSVRHQSDSGFALLTAEHGGVRAMESSVTDTMSHVYYRSRTVGSLSRLGKKRDSAVTDKEKRVPARRLATDGGSD